MRRGPVNGRRECMTVRLSSSRRSPCCQGKATQMSSMSATASSMARGSMADPSPKTTASLPRFRESFQPVYAATTELKNDLLCVCSLPTRTAGSTFVTVRRLPSSIHSHVLRQEDTKMVVVRRRRTGAVVFILLAGGCVENGDREVELEVEQRTPSSQAP